MSFPERKTYRFTNSSLQIQAYTPAKSLKEPPIKVFVSQFKSLIFAPALWVVIMQSLLEPTSTVPERTYYQQIL